MAPEALQAEALQMPIDNIPADAAFGRLPQWDSVAHLRLMLLLEEKLGLTLDEKLMNSVTSLEALRGLVTPNRQADNRHPAWEAIYASQRQLNKYPHHYLVSYVFRTFPTAEARRACRVLEMGCGAGNNVIFLAREGFSVFAIEGAPSGFAQAKKAIGEAGVEADLRLGDFTKLPWEDNSFDLVIDRGSFTCVTEAALSEALAETARVLKPGGRFFSMIHSVRNPNLALGRQVSPHTFDDFTSGAFIGHGTITALDETGVRKFYGDALALTSMRLIEETDYLPEVKPAAALWVITAQKLA